MTTSTITRDELWQEIQAGTVVVLEALPPAYFEDQHLPGARNLPLDDLDALAGDLIPSRDARVVTYCSNPSCPNSKTAANRLRQLGYSDVRAYEGGKQEWIESGLPTEAGAPVA